MELRSIYYAIPYAIVFILMLFLYLLERKGQRIRNNDINKGTIIINRARYSALFVLLIFIGLRGHIYTDCIEYYRFFEDVPLIWKVHVDDYTTMEPGFVIYTSLFKTIIPNYYCWVFFNSLFDLLVLYFFFKNNTKSIVLAFLVFLAYQGLYIEFNLYRNAKAISFFILSIPYLQNRKILPYMILNCIGGCFHVAAFLFIPIYFIIHLRWTKPVLWGMFIVANLCFFLQLHPTTFLLDQLTAGASDYVALKANKFANKTETYGLSFGYIEKTFITLLVLFLYNKLTHKQNINTIYCNCAVFFYFITFLFSDIAIFTERLSYLFIFALWVIIPEMFYTSFKIRRIVVVGILLILFLRIVESNMTAICYYDNLLWGIMDINKRATIVDMFVY